jgi:hypothetical protein
MPRRLRARVHDVTQSLTRIGVVLIGGEAISVIANLTLKISFRDGSGTGHLSKTVTEGGLKHCRARYTGVAVERLRPKCLRLPRLLRSRMNARRPPHLSATLKAALIIGAGRGGEHRQAGGPACDRQ